MASSWLLWVAVALLLGAACFVLDKSGQLIRQGVELKKDIDAERLAAMVLNKPIDHEKYGQLIRKAKLLVSGPLIVLCILYNILLLRLSWAQQFC
jgi:hypothetical protein